MNFQNKLLKIRSEFRRYMRFVFILDIISILSIFYSMFIIFNLEYFLSELYFPIPIKIIPPLLAFIIAMICTFLLHRKDHKINVIGLIENKNPELREKLRTAYDNREETNIIVESLKNLVSDSLSVVKASKLLKTRTVVIKILMTIIFISGATLVSTNPGKYAIPPETLTNMSDTITGTVGNVANETMMVLGRQEVDDKVGATGQGDIFGKPEIAPIEGRPVDLSLAQGVGTGFEVQSVSETRNQFIRSAEFPVDVLGSNVSDGGYSVLMKKTETEKKLIEDYAVELSKI